MLDEAPPAEPAPAEPASALGARGYPREPDGEDSGRGRFSFGVWGDVPYSAAQFTVGVPNLIADMNSHDLAFSAHTGDWKPGAPGNPGDSGGVFNCTLPFYRQVKGLLNSLRAPAVMTPGDNDWTDCDRGNKYGTPFNSLSRLNMLRQVLFDGNPYTHGRRRLRQEVQTDRCLGWAGSDASVLTPGPHANATCSENRRWRIRGVVFATFHAIGSCNNLCDSYPDPEEWAVRNAANIKWVREAFAAATASGAPALVLISQADPTWNTWTPPGFAKRDPYTLAFVPSTENSVDGFLGLLEALREEVAAFGRPVLYVHGDYHFLTIDQPMFAKGTNPPSYNNGNRLVQLTRLMHPGGNPTSIVPNGEVGWVKVTVDPRSPEVFSFTPMVVRANNPQLG